MPRLSSRGTRAQYSSRRRLVADICFPAGRIATVFKPWNTCAIFIPEVACRRQRPRKATSFTAWIRTANYSSEAAWPPTRSRFVARCPDGSGPSSGILLCDLFPRVAAFRPYPGLHSVVPYGDARQNAKCAKRRSQRSQRKSELITFNLSLITYFGAEAGPAACRVIHRKRIRHIRLRRLHHTPVRIVPKTHPAKLRIRNNLSRLVISRPRRKPIRRLRGNLTFESRGAKGLTYSFLPSLIPEIQL